MDTTSLTAIEREIIDDIHAVCRRCGWPVDVRPGFQAYLDQRGHFYEKQIKRLGGWKRLCALGGMQGVEATTLCMRHDAFAADFDRIVADVRRVAQSLRLKPGAPLTRAIYHRSGGRYGPGPIIKLGGWAPLSAAAGHPSRRGHNREPRRQWQKTRPTLTQAEFDAALDRALGRTPAPRGLLRIMRVKPRKVAGTPVPHDAPVAA
jgi:hypothetical protein